MAVRARYRSLGEVLDYRLTPPHPHPTTVRRALEKWRKEQGVSIWCDKPGCQLHVPNPRWNGESVKMILDHIDGNRKNDRPSNLQFLCPNCDSQQPTRGGKNKGRIRNATSDSYHVVERDGQLEVKVMLSGVSTRVF